MANSLNADPKRIHSLRERQLDALREVANIGAGHAATALSQMTGAPIDVSVPFLQVAPLEEIPESFGERDERIAAVVIPVVGDLTGQTLLVLPFASACRLAEVLLDRRPGDVEDFGELERSAMTEAGNIVSAAHMNALSDFLGLMLLPSVPRIEFDRVDAVLPRLTPRPAHAGGYAFSIETRFVLRGAEPVTGQFLYLPSLASLRIIFDALRLG
jgi:chemotaxis protein CheC